VTGDTNAIYWDPYSVELNDNPHGIRLRDEVPVYRNDDLDFWALSRFTDVDAASWDTTTFSSAHGTVLERTRTEPRGGGMMIFLDPPEHTRLSRQGPRSSS
jgi:cytochrome P450